MHKAKLYGAVALGVLALIVILQNTASVETKLLFVTISMPRAVLLTTCLGLGFGVGYLVRWTRERRQPE